MSILLDLYVVKMLKEGMARWFGKLTGPSRQVHSILILLVDMFRGHVPDEYGEEDHIVLDSDSAWREEIIEPTLNAAKLF